MGPLDEGQLLFIVLVILLFYTIRGCWFCLLAFRDDDTGKWITIGEFLSAICFFGIILDILFSRILGDRSPIVSIIFYISFITTAIGAIVRSEKGFKAVKDSYRRIR